VDWGQGEYERTARELEPAAAAAINALHPHRGELILDVACGTGNAALLAARAGAHTIGIDASARLLDVAARRARMEAVDCVWRVADVEDLPYEDDSFDGVISVFGVIFANDADKGAAELKRVVKPGGTIVITAWLPTGPIADFMRHVRQAVAEYSGREPQAVAHFNWSDEENLRRLLGPGTEVTDHQLSFRGASAASWVLEQAEFHPAWRDVRKALPQDRYQQLLGEITEMVTDANVDPHRFEITSGYVIARAKG
jgi:ubiquinone/menaquinone biosynthesis C-methylase UbiE